MLEKEVLSLDTPNARTLEAFRRWFNSKAIPVLWGHDRDLFVESADLIALAPVDSDRLNRLLRRYCGWFLKVWHPPMDVYGTAIANSRKEASSVDETHVDMYYFSERRIQWLGAVVSGIFSALLLIGAIVCLLFVSDKGTSMRIGMIVLFTCLFAGVVSLLTNARRAEIFASTAA